MVLYFVNSYSYQQYLVGMNVDRDYTCCDEEVDKDKVDRLQNRPEKNTPNGYDGNMRDPKAYMAI